MARDKVKSNLFRAPFQQLSLGEKKKSIRNMDNEGAILSGDESQRHTERIIAHDTQESVEAAEGVLGVTPPPATSNGVMRIADLRNFVNNSTECDVYQQALTKGEKPWEIIEKVDAKEWVADHTRARIMAVSISPEGELRQKTVRIARLEVEDQLLKARLAEKSEALELLERKADRLSTVTLSAPVTVVDEELDWRKLLYSQSHLPW